MKKKFLAMGLTVVLGISTLTGCGGSDGEEKSLGAITVVSREDGSGTRGAFTELLEITVDDVDHTTDTAEITQSTSVMMTTVAGNDAAIGYVSLGSLDDSVKALQVDGVEVTVENINSGDYKVARPFNIVTNNEVSDLAQDFMDYIMSDEGQAIVAKEGYIKVDTTGTYEEKSGLEGKITLAGSTSVAPVMDKLADAYKQINENVTIEIQQSGSSADMLANGIVKPEHVPSFAGDIFKECKRMLHLIDDIIRLSQLDEQSVSQEKEPVDLHELSKSVKRSLSVLAEEMKITLKVEGEPVKVMGVPTMLEEIISNLLENAIKYNKENGSVTVTVSQENATAKLEVKDTGIGIPTEDMERIFERFYRVDKSHSKRIGGTGLGLSIVKHAVQYHEGMIRVASVEGEGTIMTVTMKAIK